MTNDNNMNNDLLTYIKAKNAKSEAWVAEDPKNRWSGLLMEDIAGWATYGITTPAQLEHYLLVSQVFEMTRAIWGYKPSWSHLNNMSDADLTVEVKILNEEGRRLQEERQRECDLAYARELEEQRVEAERVKELTSHRTGFTIGELVNI